MLRYMIDVLFSDGRHKRFAVDAADDEIARKFGLSTAQMYIRNHNLHCKVSMISVFEM